MTHIEWRDKLTDRELGLAEGVITELEDEIAAFSEDVGKLKDMLGIGEYCIVRNDREPMGWGEMIMVGDVLEAISKHLLAKHDYEKREAIHKASP